MFLRLGAATLNQTPLDWVGNLARIRAAIAAARAQGVQLLVLPELCITGYGCEDVFHSIAHSERAARHLLELAAEIRDIVVVVGAPVRLPGGLYNGACFLAEGSIVGISLKQFLAGDGIHYEPRWFRPWPSGRRTVAQIGASEVPVGDLVYEIGGVRVGAEICEDAWVPNRPGAQLALANCDIVAGPSASHFAFGKWATRERIVAEGSRAFGCAYVYSNPVGNESGRAIFDGQRLVCAAGDVVARAELLSFREWDLTSAVVDIRTLRMRRARTASLRPDEVESRMVRVPFEWKESPAPASPPLGAATGWIAGPHAKEEEFARAVALGLHDYMRKSRSRGFVVSLSGGADSAACSTLAALGVQFARREIGEPALAARMAYLRLDPASYCGGLLDTVYQASANSGAVTRDAAASVAAALGSRHSEWKIEDFVLGCRANVEASLGRPLDWNTDDIALQNIQARVRAPGVWMLANVRGSLLLATSNRSEAAVGYTTMDGDTAGSISPIAGIDKHFLRGWLRWMATTGPEGIGPVPALMKVVDQAPTAELRPPAQLQTDEADLMPYDLLDAIERLAVRDRLEPVEILKRLAPEWESRAGGAAGLAASIRKFFSLWSRNQWKRERFAPSFHLDDESLDPKTWCRFPILSGGFAEELGEMKQ